MAEPMNIVILNQYALPKGAGGITRHGDIGAELVKRGHEVTIIASSFDHATRRRVKRPPEADGIRFQWIDAGTYTENDTRRVRSMVRFTTLAAWEARRLKPPPDIIIGSSPHLLTGLAAWSAARLRRVPWVFEVRDFWPSSLVDLGGLQAGGMTHRMLERLERFLYARADAVVTVPPNGSARREELTLDETPWVHVPNAATVGSIERSSADGGRFTVVYAGAHGLANDLSVVVQAAALLRQRNPQHAQRLELLFVGDGPERGRLMEQAAGLRTVEFRGAVPKSVVSEVLSRADAGLVHLAPADVFRYGLSPNKLFDYFAAGLPVLISAEQPTVVDEAHAGIRYQPGDPAALADAIVRLMDLPPAERKAMGARGRELVRSRYSVAAVTDQYEALLRDVVGKRRRPSR